MVKQSFVNSIDEHEACVELSRELGNVENSLNILFASSRYDQSRLGQAIKESFPEGTIACTTSGEVTADGYRDHGIQALSLENDSFSHETIAINLEKDLLDENIVHLKAKIDKIIAARVERYSNGQTFAILLVDGLSIKEEPLTSILSDILNEIPLVGGSAADSLKFEKTFVFSDGEMKSGVATLTIVSSEVPFEVFKTDHFTGSDKRIVVTDADPQNRIVKEINGITAADYYAEMLGKTRDELGPKDFSNFPITLKIGDKTFVRSIQCVNEDGSLTFYCAIDRGIVLSLANKQPIFDQAKSFFNKLENRMGEVELTLLFECVLRKVEIESMDSDIKNNIFELYKKYNAVGFHTYGEQYCGIHVNQTITGIAFGKK